MNNSLVRLVQELPVRLGSGVTASCSALGTDSCELRLQNPLAAGEAVDITLRTPLGRSLRFAAVPGEAATRDGDSRVRQRFTLVKGDGATREALEGLLTQLRKDGHLELCLNEDVESRVGPGFADLRLPHHSLPDIDGDEVSTVARFVGKRMRLPLLITGMTGGTARGGEVNLALAAVAQRTGLAMGLGSQRSMLEDPSLTSTFEVRDVAPDIPLLANLGAVQLNYGVTPEGCARVVEAVGADALCLHLNVVQEMIQPEGNRNFTELAHSIAKVVDEVPVPVLLKETGTGMSPEVAQLAVDLGCAGIDVSGLGGTSWPRVEALRHSDPRRRRVGNAFRDWGMPTADAIRTCREAAPETLLIASGGVRTGQDMAKCIALGADLCGMALPLLRAVTRSEEAAVEFIGQLDEELRVAMTCSGANTLSALRERGVIDHRGANHD